MLVISGPPGVGKTTWEVFSRAAERDEAPAMAGLDFLGAAWPAPGMLLSTPVEGAQPCRSLVELPRDRQ